MENLTDEQIIKALECCDCRERCADCPLKDNDYCKDVFSHWAVDLINRQAAEIESLKRTIDEKDKEILGLQKRIIFWREDLNYQPEKIKSEAIKEFAERAETLVLPLLLAATLEERDMVYRCLNIIDNLVKEMTEENE